jgi:GNAT superfamily N-acetyltransferase
MAEPELHYFCKPTALQPVARPIEFLTVQEFLADESACKCLWELVSTQFRTRGKFLAVWPGVRFVALHRNAEGAADAFLLVNAPINWQIDYVVVAAEARGQGIASALVCETVNQALLRGAPYVMLTSKESLRPLYEACGFTPVEVPVLNATGTEAPGAKPQGRANSSSLHHPSLTTLPFCPGPGPRKGVPPCAESSGSPASAKRRPFCSKDCGGSNTAATTAPG